MGDTLFIRTGSRSTLSKIVVMRRLVIFVVMVQLILLGFAHSSPAKESYFDMNLEQLMQIEVTSASRRQQPLSDTAAAVFVITQDDLKRAGVTSIPQALRMVPGVQVGKIEADNWAVSIRGFNQEFANKLLVLIDGRSIYSPVTSGVYWDEHLLPIDNIERIEVIRGPGGSLWGENAVNRIVNIITKNAKETQGFYLSSGVGNEEEGLLSLRYGGKVGSSTFFRIYGKGMKGDSAKWEWDGSAHDDWNYLTGGVRVDSYLSASDTITVTGALTRGLRDKDFSFPIFVPPYLDEMRFKMAANTGHLMARWRHSFKENSELTLKGYFWSEGRSYSNYSFTSNTLDFEGQYRISLDRHLLTVGADYRHIWTHFSNTYQVSLLPPKRRDHFYSIYFQDEISLNPRLKLTVGSRFSHNPFTDWEVQPTARLLWHINEGNSLWCSVSRAVRIPDLARHGIEFIAAAYKPTNSPVPMGVIVTGKKHLDSESVVSYEVGYRRMVSQRFSLDVAAYFNKYRKLYSFRNPDDISGLIKDPLPHVNVYAVSDNLGDAESYGFEAAANLQVTPWWRLQGAFTFGRMFVHYSGKTFFQAFPEKEEEGRMPRHQFSLRSSMDISSKLSLNTWLRYSDNLWKNEVPSYFTMDATVLWKPLKNLEVSLSGFNLFDNRHPEFKPNITIQGLGEVERSFFGKITWRF